MKRKGNSDTETLLLKELNRTVTSLVESKTKLTRKRARTRFRSMAKLMLDTFRPLLSDGTMVEKKSSVVCVCPLCDTAIKYWSSLLPHLSNYHNIVVAQSFATKKTKRGPYQYHQYKCFGCFKPCVGVNGLFKHLAHVQRKGEWKNHVAQAAMRVTFAQPKGNNP